MPLQTRQDLADYCLRTLGAPVLNIEVDEEQLSDAIENALAFYHDYHPDGVERDYVKHLFTDTVVTLDDASLVVVGNTLVSGTKLGVVKSISGNNVTLAPTKTAKLEIGDTVTFPGGSADVTAVTLGDADNGWIPIDEDIQGIIRVLPWTPSYADGLFDITYQLRMNDLRNLHSGTMNYFTTTMEYLSLLDFLLRKEKQFRFNRRMNRMYLDINWSSDVNAGSYVVVECYRLLDDDLYPEVFNDPWLKKYAAAWVKRYWGANLRKYQGISLPGGITLDGERIYGEANNEIRELEQDLINNQAPLMFQMG